MNFEDNNRQKKSWICHGLKICGVVGTQTDKVAEDARVKKTPIMKDAEAQTDVSLGVFRPSIDGDAAVLHMKLQTQDDKTWIATTRPAHEVEGKKNRSWPH
jgi:hypothetical protein